MQVVLFVALQFCLDTVHMLLIMCGALGMYASQEVQVFQQILPAITPITIS